MYAVQKKGYEETNTDHKELDYVMIGHRIRQQREILGYTREYLAHSLSVSVNFCRDIEIGAKGMSLSTLAKLGNTLQLSLDYILFGKVPEEETEALALSLKACRTEKRKLIEDILKILLATN